MQIIQDGFWEYTSKDIDKTLKLAGVAVIVILSLSLVYDIMVLGDYLHIGLMVRLIPVILTFAILILSFFKKIFIKNYYQIITAAITVVITLPIAVNGALAGGFESNYYLGLFMTEIAFVAFIPLKRSIAIVTVILINLMLVFSYWYFWGSRHLEFIYISDLMNFFIITVFVHHLLLKYRYNAWLKMVEAEEKTYFLEQQNTKQKRILKELLELEQKNRIFINNTVAGIYLLDKDYHFSFANEQWRKMSGYSMHELRSKTPLDIISDRSCPLLKNFYDNYRNNVLDRFSADVEFVRSDNTKFWASLSSNIIRENLEGQDSIFCIVVDINEKIKLNDELQKMLSDLSNSKALVESSARELIELNNKLLVSEKYLQELNKTKDKLFSVIAHDLRNPLSSFHSIINLLATDWHNMNDNEKLNMIHIMLQSSQGIFVLLDNLLAWALSHSEKISCNPENIEVYAFIEELIQLNGALLKTKNLTADNNTLPNHIVFADKMLLGTIMRNLFSNAIKFTPVGGRIKFSSIDAEEFIELSVSDNGVGISEERLAGIFDYDMQKSTKGTEKESGTGLGLMLCKDFAERNRGLIKAESTLGSGTVFKLKIPRANL